MKRKKIPLAENLQVARKVLAQVQKIGVEDAAGMWVEAYSNGREQGYCIMSVGDKGRYSIAFSEYRNSDSIVVYVGKDKHFFMQGNVPDEDTYENKKFFKSGEYEKAAKFIIKNL